MQPPTETEVNAINSNRPSGPNSAHHYGERLETEYSTQSSQLARGSQSDNHSQQTHRPGPVSPADPASKSHLCLLKLYFL